jgi:hypothetical protein
MVQKTAVLKLLNETIGLSLEIISDDFEEYAGNTNHKIVFQIIEEEPDLFAFGVLFALSLMSFTFAAPGGIRRSNLFPMKSGILITLFWVSNSETKSFISLQIMFPVD